MNKLITLVIMMVMVTVVIAGRSADVAAEDLLVWADSPIYEILVGRDVTFSWTRKNQDKPQSKFELTTNVGTVTLSSANEYFTWLNFPYGPGTWSVKVWRDSALDPTFYVGKTSEQNFYHYNNTPGPDPSAPIESTKWEYKDGPRGGGADTTLYYEVLKDYTIDLRARFANLDPLPEHYFKWDKTEAQRIAIMDYIDILPNIKWEFIELENGMLTVKKGYRWDGASTPWNNQNIADNREFYLRCSCIHDSMYDLMRMGYLEADNDANEFGDEGFLNRLIADSLLYMIMVEDGRNDGHAANMAQSDFELVRLGGFGKTHDDSLLSPWKYHVSELTAWASDGKVELHWLPADISDKDPNNYGVLNSLQGKEYSIHRSLSGSSSWQEIGQAQYPVWSPLPPLSPYYSFYNDSKVFFTDTGVTNGEIYYYQVKSLTDESNLNWKDRHHDESDVEVVVPAMGPGNALQLQVGGSSQYVEANTVSNGLGGDSISFEAWVYPGVQTGKPAIISFNTQNGGNYNLLMYDGDNEKFCNHDNDNSYTCSTTDFAANNWYHVAVTIDENNSGVLWVDGEQEAIFSTATRPEKTALFSIGQEWDGNTTSQHFKGKIDEVRIWNVTRTQAEIVANMCTPMRANKTGLAALFHFDEPQNSRKIYDATMHGHEGILLGFPPFPMPPNLAPFVPSDTDLSSSCDACFFDAEPDTDIDGVDLATYANEGAHAKIKQFALAFGNNCQ